MFDFDNIGIRLRKIREDCHLSQRDFAASINFSVRAYQTWERGENLPSLYALAEIVTHYGVSANYLLGLSDAPAKIGHTLVLQPMGRQFP